MLKLSGIVLLDFAPNNNYYIFDVCMYVCFVSVITGDGSAGSFEKEWLLRATRGGETQVKNKHRDILACHSKPLA